MAELALRDPFAEFEQLRKDMDRLFAHTAGRWLDGARWRWQPSVDVYETPTEVRVYAELPGIDPQDVELNFIRDSLTISAELRTPVEGNDVLCHLMERSYGKFSRTIRLAVPIDSNKAKATFRHGLLEVVLPKAEEARPKPITIEVS